MVILSLEHQNGHFQQQNKVYKKVIKPVETTILAIFFRKIRLTVVAPAGLEADEKIFCSQLTFRNLCLSFFPPQKNVLQKLLPSSTSSSAAAAFATLLSPSQTNMLFYVPNPPSIRGDNAVN